MKEYKDFIELPISSMTDSVEVPPERAYDHPCSRYSPEDYSHFLKGLMTVAEKLSFEKHCWDCLPCLKAIKEQEENETLLEKTFDLLNSLDRTGDS